MFIPSRSPTEGTKVTYVRVEHAVAVGTHSRRRRRHAASSTDAPNRPGRTAQAVRPGAGGRAVLGAAPGARRVVVSACPPPRGRRPRARGFLSPPPARPPAPWRGDSAGEPGPRPRHSLRSAPPHHDGAE